jgi:sugar phosphate permease
MAQEHAAADNVSGTSRRLMMPGLASGHATFHWIVQSFAVALPEIQMAFGLNTVGAAGVMSARDLAAGLIALPGGVVVDVLRRHWGLLLAGCLTLAALGSLVMGVSPVYWLLLLGIAVVAISHSVWHLPASASLSHHFAERRGTALAMHGVGGGFGDVVGPLATGVLLTFLGWRGLLSIYAIAPFFFGFMAVWMFRHIGHVSTGSGAAADSPTMARRLEMTRRLLRNPILWGLTFVRGLRGMCLISLVTVLPLYLGNELGMNPAWRGFHIALLIVIGIAAKPVAGYLSDRVGRKQVLVPGLIWSCLVALAMVPFNDGITLTLAVALMGLFLYPDQPILTAAVFDVVGREVASTGLGVVACIAFLMSAGSALVAGAIYQTMGFTETMYYIAALFGLAAVVFALLPLTRSASE